MLAKTRGDMWRSAGVATILHPSSRSGKYHQMALCLEWLLRYFRRVSRRLKGLHQTATRVLREVAKRCEARALLPFPTFPHSSLTKRIGILSGGHSLETLRASEHRTPVGRDHESLSIRCSLDAWWRLARIYQYAPVCRPSQACGSPPFYVR